MERINKPQGGELHDTQVYEQEHRPEHVVERPQPTDAGPIAAGVEAAQTDDRLTDEQLVHYGITEALREDRPIDDATARVIASQLHGGQASPLYALASSGALVDGLRDELDSWRRDDTPVEVEPWLDALHEYLDSRTDQPEAVEGWSELWPAVPPSREDDEPDGADEERQPYSPPATAGGQTTEPATGAGALHEPFDRTSAASVTALGQLASVVDQGAAADDQDEVDTFPWTDAATWSPDGGHHDELARDQLDELFAEVPDDEIGTVEDIGWFGLFKNGERPGGVLLSQNEYGIRRARQYQADDELTAAWDELRREHDAFIAATRAHTRQAEGREDGGHEASSGIQPEIWVGSLSDYANGRLYGVWMDATLEPDELQDAVRFLLRGSCESDAEEWAVMDYDSFGREITNLLGEYPSLKLVSKIAQGIAEHGEAYAAWAAYVGPEQEDQLDRFKDHYLGEFESMEGYAEYLLEESGAYRVVDEAPEWLQPYLGIDTEMYAQDLGYELHVVEVGGGGVWVFDGRC